MPTPPKPALVLVQENKSHRTKAEIKQRENAEASTLTGSRIRIWPEVKANETAKKMFGRIRGLLKKINKDDALYENVINRYAQLYAECLEFEKRREEFFESKVELERDYRETDEKESELTAAKYYKLLVDIQKNIVALDRQIQIKRKMMLDIEKESLMTVAAALRSIPKAPLKEKADDNEDMFD